MKRIASSVLIMLTLAGVAPASGEGKRYAVVVGIDRYERPDINPLRCAVADAHSLALGLRSLDFDKVFELTSNEIGSDDYPNRVNVLFRLDWLRKRVAPEDTVIFFFSGHGMQVEESNVKEQPVFLLTKESDPRSLITLTNSACPASEVTKILNGMPARRILVIYDACRSSVRSDRGGDDNKLSGTAARGLTLKRDHNSPQAQGSCVATLFSCSPGQRAYESQKTGHGYFTYYLLQALEGKASGPDGRVSLQGMFDYLATQVKSAADESNLVQTPYWSVSGSLPMSSWILASKPAAFKEPGAAADISPQAAAFIKSALADIEKNDLRHALDDYTRAFQLAPRAASILVDRARVRRALADNPGAEVDLRQVLQINPNSADAYLLLGDIKFERNDFSHAVEDFNRSLQIAPRFADCYNDRARAERCLGLNQECIADCNRALELDPKLAAAFYNRAYAKTALKDFQGALQDYNRLLDMTPGYFYGLTQRGDLRLFLGDNQGAIDDYNRALQIDPNQPGVREALEKARAGLHKS